MQPSEFLTELWGEAPPGKLLVWTLPDKRSHWYNNGHRTVQNLPGDIRPDSNMDVYTGLVALPMDHPERPNARYRKDSRIAAMACMWADIDIQHELHKGKKAYPPSQEAALSLLDELPYRPTIVNHSGHGLQAFWVFETPWMFATKADQKKAEGVARWWHTKITAACSAHGWAIDSVFDITRVMRVPGYMNHKDPENPKPVSNIIRGGPKVNAAQVLSDAASDTQQQAQTLTAGAAQAGTAAGQQGAPTRRKKTGSKNADPLEQEPQDAANAQLEPEDTVPVGLRPNGISTDGAGTHGAGPGGDNPESVEEEQPFEFEVPPYPAWPYSMLPDAEPPTARLHAMLENSDRFKETWNRKRRDFPYDESASSYDMSLTNQAAAAGWTNQEIINLLIKFRTKHNLALKLRDSYFRPTLQKAREGQKKTASTERLSNLIAETALIGETAVAEPPAAKAATKQGGEAGQPGETEGPGPGNGDAVREELRNLWGFYIFDLVRSKGDPPTFWMSTDHGDITIGGVGNITNQTNFINIVSACTLKYINPVKKPEWGERVQNLFSITRSEDLGPLSNPVEETKEWTDRYLDEKWIEHDDRAGAMNQRQPFSYQDDTHIFLEDLREWLRTRAHVDISAHELGRRLKRAGFSQARPHVPKSPEDTEATETNRTTRHTWRVPRQI